MTERVPRLLLAGTGSGCGKTTVCCALLRALRDRGVKAAPAKCGPDYIDPMFHLAAAGAESGNLDPFFFDDATLRALLSRRAAGRDVTVIEGVMGYYDGLGFSSDASSYALCARTETPAVLILNARGAAASLLAAAEGFLRFVPDSRVSGLIFNGCGPMVYERLAAEVRRRWGGRVRPLGYFPRLEDCELPSRHLGLVTAAELPELEDVLTRLGSQASESLDLDGLLDLAETAPPLEISPAPPARTAPPVRLAVARDLAFCFYYADSLALLRDLGAELVPFSPLADAALPEGTAGLYLGGGYPELHAARLAENASMRAAVRAALAAGLPCVAECGGFMYLTEAIGEHPMVGALPGRCFDAGRLTRFGYVTLRAERGNLLCPAGETVRGHEFHRWDCTAPGNAFTAEKPDGRRWRCVHATDRLYAGFPHFHFAAASRWAERFLQICREGAITP